MSVSTLFSRRTHLPAYGVTRLPIGVVQVPWVRVSVVPTHGVLEGLMVGTAVFTGTGAM